MRLVMDTASNGSMSEIGSRVFHPFLGAWTLTFLTAIPGFRHPTDKVWVFHRAKNPQRLHPTVPSQRLVQLVRIFRELNLKRSLLGLEHPPLEPELKHEVVQQQNIGICSKRRLSLPSCRSAP